jgi:N-acetyl-beta-hexosaminidase
MGVISNRLMVLRILYSYGVADGVSCITQVRAALMSTWFTMSYQNSYSYRFNDGMKAAFSTNKDASRRIHPLQNSNDH